MSSILRATQGGFARNTLASASVLTQRRNETFHRAQIRQSSWSETAADIYLGISNSQLVHLCQQNLISMHDYSGLTWCSTIIVTTVLMRSLVTLPLAVYTNRIRARLELISLELPALADELRGEVALAKHLYKLDDQKCSVLYRRSLKKQWDKLVVRENCHPVKTMIVLWGQIPLWICQSMAIRNMVNLMPDPTSTAAKEVLTQLAVGGCAWFPDLTAADSTLIMPIVLCVLNLMNIEFHTLEKTGPDSRFRNAATIFFRLISIALIPIAASVPSSLALYWTTSSAYSLIQNVIMVSPGVKRFLRIPTNTPSHLEQPYSVIAERFLEKWRLRK